MTRLLAMLALLIAGLSTAGDHPATNQMPEPIHDLMETEGYPFAQKNLSLPPPNTNSLRTLKPVKEAQSIPLELPAKKAGWNLWDNSSIKQVNKNANSINGSGLTSLTQYEYDITYSFQF